jgi:hypothetical protein
MKAEPNTIKIRLIGGPRDGEERELPTALCEAFPTWLPDPAHAGFGYHYYPGESTRAVWRFLWVKAEIRKAKV